MNARLAFPGRRPHAAAAASASGRPLSAPHDRYRVDLFTEIGSDALATLERIGVRRRYEDRAVVQQRGDTARHALVIVQGRLRATAVTTGGSEQLVRWMERGEVSGLSSVLADLPVPVDLVAEGAVEVLQVAQQPLLQWLRSDAEAALLFARMLSMRVNELFDAMLNRGGPRTDHRLAERVWALLQGWARENGVPGADGWRTLRLTHADVAGGVGASRQRVSTELGALALDGRVRLGYRRIEVRLDTPR